MSTRSQLRFVQRGDQDDESNDSDRVAQVYRRSDGYPTSVLQDLIRLKELLDATHAEREPAYTAAAFVFLDKLSRPHRRGLRASHLAVPQPLEHALEELVAKPA
jgi:hypothetical protein